MVFILQFNLWLNTFRHSSCVVSSRGAAPSQIRLWFPHSRDAFHVKANYEAFLFRHAAASTSGVNVFFFFLQKRRPSELVKTDCGGIRGGGSTNFCFWATGTQKYIHCIFSIFYVTITHDNSLVQRGYPVSSPCVATQLFKRTKPCSLSLGKKKKDNKWGSIKQD